MFYIWFLFNSDNNHNKHSFIDNKTKIKLREVKSFSQEHAIS